MNRKILLAVVVVTSLLVSCGKNLLRLDDPNNIGEDKFWKTERDALLGLAGVLDVFQGNNLMGKKYREFDHLTDNSTTGQNQGWLEFETDTQTPSTGTVANTWTNLYTVISRSNEVIEKAAVIPAGAIEESARKRIIAEAGFLRAYAYHDLTAIWINVPLYTMPNGAFDTPLAATSKQQVVSFFIEELTNNIIPDLPETIPASEHGRISKGAAQALLGKYYLLSENWSMAASAFREIIDGGLYHLHPDFADLFTEAGEFSAENLFEINFTGAALDQGESFSVRIDTNLATTIPSTHWTPLKNLSDSYLCTDGKPIANSTLYGTKSPLYKTATPFANRDPRLRASLYTSADVTPEGKKIWKWSNNNSFAVKKYTIISSQQYENGGPQNYYVIRYADVLLMYAEAQNEAVGPDASVHDAINAIRARVQMPQVPAALTQEEMRQYIRDERRWEFAFEHQRFFDLKRWGILGPVSAAAMPAKKLYSEPRIFYWPYPQTEMDRNAALKAQGQPQGY